MRRLFYLLAALLLWGCGTRPATLEEQELYAFTHDKANGLMGTGESNGCTVTVTYKPSDLVANQQVVNHTAHEFDSLSQHFGRYLYFTLEMLYDGKDLETAFASDPGSFADKISYLSAGLPEHIQLVTPTDTLAVQDYVYARSYGQGPSQCLVVFERPTSKTFDVQIGGHALGFEKLTFPFSINDINKTPKLKFKSI